MTRSYFVDQMANGKWSFGYCEGAHGTHKRSKVEFDSYAAARLALEAFKRKARAQR